MTDPMGELDERWWNRNARTGLTPQERAEAAEAERDRLEGLRLAARSDAEGWKSLHEESSAERDRLAGRVGELERMVEYWKEARDRQEAMALKEGRRANDAEARLHQATEALREIADDPLAPGAAHTARSTLAALAGEDEKPPEPQREGDYL